MSNDNRAKMIEAFNKLNPKTSWSDDLESDTTITRAQIRSRDKRQRYFASGYQAAEANTRNAVIDECAKAIEDLMKTHESVYMEVATNACAITIRNLKGE